MKGKKQFKFHDGDKGAALAVHVKQGRGENRFSKVLKDGTVVVRIGQGEGDLNARLLDFLSSQFGIPQGKIKIIAGADGQNKLISFIDANPKELQTKILAKLA